MRTLLATSIRRAAGRLNRALVQASQRLGTDYDAYQMAAKTFAIERLGYYRSGSDAFCRAAAQELRDKMALAADAERQTKLDALIEADAGRTSRSATRSQPGGRMPGSASRFATRSKTV